LKVGNSNKKQTQQSKILLDFENKNNIFQLSTFNFQLIICKSSINANAKQNFPHITNKTNYIIYKYLQKEVLQ